MEAQYLGDYELVRELGRGSFGTVWQARHRTTGWLRAIKLANDPRLVEQSRREAAVLDGLRHDRIVLVHEFIGGAERPGIIFEYVEGGDLGKLLAHGPLPWQRAVEIAGQVLEALGAAQAAGLIHRDVKPSNILLTREGNVKVADFGLVSAAERAGSLLLSQQTGQSGSIAGTAHYMAPELDHSAAPSPQSDLFSVGVVLYECLTGRLPRGAFRPPSEASGGRPKALDCLVMALLEPEPGDRPPSARHANEALREATRSGTNENCGAGSHKPREGRAPQAAATDGEQRGRPSRASQAAPTPPRMPQGERSPAERPAGGAGPQNGQRAEEQPAPETVREGPRTGPASDASPPRLDPRPPSRSRQVQITLGVVLFALSVVFIPRLLRHHGDPSDSAAKGLTTMADGSAVGEETLGPDGETYVWVPAGEFMMGSERGWASGEPVHRVKISQGFWMGKHEVTNARYRRFCDDTGHAFPPESDGSVDHPVTHVSWQDAVDYCEHYGMRLPTEAEWEYAARGPQGHHYPWGERWDAAKCTTLGGDSFDWPDSMESVPTHQVGTFPDGASWCGAMDMAGNVGEWCADWYDRDYFEQSPTDDPQGPASGNGHVVRGAFDGGETLIFPSAVCRSSYMYPTITGFRCALSRL